jgi:hypothetical protein
MAEYIIHCDESASKGDFCSNFYGGALVRAKDIEVVRRKLRAAKTRLNLHGEIKWEKVTENYLQKYVEMMKVFFDLIAKDRVKVRIMYTQNVHRPVGLTDEQIENRYFILYYHFLKFVFGLQYSNEDGKPIRIRLLLDQVPDTKEKVQQFKGYLCGLPKSREFREALISLTPEDISDVRSHDHNIS